MANSMRGHNLVKPLPATVQSYSQMRGCCRRRDRQTEHRCRQDRSATHVQLPRPLTLTCIHVLEAKTSLVCKRQRGCRVGCSRRFLPATSLPPGQSYPPLDLAPSVVRPMRGFELLRYRECGYAQTGYVSDARAQQQPSSCPSDGCVCP